MALVDHRVSEFRSAVAMAVEETDDGVVVDAIESIGDNTITDVFVAAAIFIASIFVALMVRRVVTRIVNRTDRGDELIGDLVGRFVAYLMIAFGFVYSLESLGVAIGPILGAMGVVGIAAAFALQAVLENFVSGVLLQIRRPFTKGDEVETNSFVGKVLSIDSRTMSIRTHDGATVQLPNSLVLNDPLVNLTSSGRLRNTVTVGIAYGTDIAAAASVALEACRGVDGVLERPAPQVIAVGFGGSSIDLECRYWHKGSIAERFRTQNETIIAIAEAFDRADIEIPFPQRVLHIDDGPKNASSLNT